MNLVPSQYRNVSIADVPVALDEESLRAHLLGRPVYRRTRYVVARHGEASAVVEVRKESEQPLFSPVTEMSMLARPEETAFVDAPETDTAVPTQMARVAARQAPGARCVIVRGRYSHVSFILDPAPIQIGVVEVVPPWPPKLADQLSRVLELAEGRASGTVGIYEPSGAVREDVIAALVSVAGPDFLVFEAPREQQQAWFVRRFGPDVNLANVTPADVLGLETLRLSLRADTYGAWSPGSLPAHSP